MGTKGTEHYFSQDFFITLSKEQQDEWVLARCSDKAKGREMLAAYPSVTGQPVPEEDWDWNDDDELWEDEEDDWEFDAGSQNALSSSLSPDDDEPWDDVWEDD